MTDLAGRAKKLVLQIVQLIFYDGTQSINRFSHICVTTDDIDFICDSDIP